MQLTIKGRNVQVDEWMKEYVEKKIGRLGRYLPGINEARIELAEEKTQSAASSQVAQVTLRAGGKIIRSQERAGDLMAAIDAVIDKIYRQIARYKGKRQDRRHIASRPERRAAMVEEEFMPELEDREATEESRHIVRTKHFQMLPMSPDEAIEQMELLGHDFFVFYNADSGQVNVVYRRKAGDYGLIIPELA